MGEEARDLKEISMRFICAVGVVRRELVQGETLSIR